jgi:hypothetical protein
MLMPGNGVKCDGGGAHRMFAKITYNSLSGECGLHRAAFLFRTRIYDYILCDNDFSKTYHYSLSSFLSPSVREHHQVHGGETISIVR